MIRKVILSLLIIFSLLCAEKIYVLSDLIKQADQYNPQIKAAEAEVQQYQALAGSNSISWLPNISIGQNIDQTVNNPGHYSSVAFGLNPLFEYWSRADQNKAQYQQALAKLEQTKRDVHAEVTAVYEELLSSQKSQEIYQRAYAAALDKLRVAKRFFAAGTLSPSDLMAVIDLVANYEIKIQTEEAHSNTVESKLKALTSEKF